MTDARPSLIQAAEMESLISALESLVDGAAAAERLIAAGPAAIPWLERFLLNGPARTVALPRCRAVHALGELGAQGTLLAYFGQHRHPEDAAVRLAEDAVRSAAAEELAKHKCDEVYKALLDAATNRITGGLIRALSEFRRAKGIPILFTALDDDLCREEARAALRMMPTESRSFAGLLLRGAHPDSLRFASSLRERRSVLQLLRELGADAEDWPSLREYLQDPDRDSVIAVAGIGFALERTEDYPHIIDELFRISSHLNWAQEDDVTRMLDLHPEQTRTTVRRLRDEASSRGEQPSWLSPRWRILRHFSMNEPTSKS
ncbi:MAG TPA: HEAT repeat domain-containing protein [Acidobacteriaceae bacterium]|nr:HEAT repeat domain-containing protein [Acidobacteriaceae bacterium]